MSGEPGDRRGDTADRRDGGDDAFEPDGGRTAGGFESVAYEERLRTDTEAADGGSVHFRKSVDTERHEETVPRGVEHADVERGGPTGEGDSGEILTLEDGSISVPVFEEQIVVEKRLVVRERVIIRKHTVTEEHRVSADLRRERLEIDADDDVLRTDPPSGTS